MVVGIVIVSLISFIIIDVILRITLQKMKEAKLYKERQKALDIGLKLDIAGEAKTLKRVTVDDPKARILAVDDEGIILDSFRKILVIAGYSIDTVEKGSEALLLVKKNDYDFVFTDLKMPEMDGVEVTKSVKHLRPDIDVIVITGFATIETAVDVMKYGAMDYVQKPFTEDELVEFVDQSLIKRDDRIEREMKPTVNLVTTSSKESDSMHEFNIPAGVFVSPGHTWSSIELNGMIRIGIDDFAQKLIGQIDGIELPEKGQNIKKGEPVFSIVQADRKASFKSPVTGVVKYINTNLLDNVELIKKKPYEHGWICYIDAIDLNNELDSLMIGASAVSWYQKEIDRFTKLARSMNNNKENIGAIVDGEDHIDYHHMNDNIWKEFNKSFLKT